VSVPERYLKRTDNPVALAKARQWFASIIQHNLGMGTNPVSSDSTRGEMHVGKDHGELGPQQVFIGGPEVGNLYGGGRVGGPLHSTLPASVGVSDLAVQLAASEDLVRGSRGY